MRDARLRSGDELVVGEPVHIEADVDLGGLAPGEVEVQAVLGKLGDTDELTDVVTVAMEPDGAGRFAVSVPLAHTGSAGFTVRVLPRHPLLASHSELGKVVLAQS